MEETTGEQISAPNLVNGIMEEVRAIAFLRQSGVPLKVLYLYVRDKVRKLRRFSCDQAIMAEVSANLDRQANYTRRWFDGNAPTWLRILRAEGMLDKPLNVLEIGAFEGRSTRFCLQYLPHAHVVAVDPWSPYGEVCGEGVIEAAERLFDQNTCSFGSRVRKFKGSSLSFFASQEPAQKWDLIYIDGSHFADDVLLDAILGFSILNAGGIMIIDDLKWRGYQRIQHNPAYAISAFLRYKRDEIEIIAVSRQLYLKKKPQPGQREPELPQMREHSPTVGPRR